MSVAQLPPWPRSLRLGTCSFRSNLPQLPSSQQLWQPPAHTVLQPCSLTLLTVFGAPLCTRDSLGGHMHRLLNRCDHVHLTLVLPYQTLAAWQPAQLLYSTPPLHYHLPIVLVVKSLQVKKAARINHIPSSVYKLASTVAGTGLQSGLSASLSKASTACNQPTAARQQRQ